MKNFNKAIEIACKNGYRWKINVTGDSILLDPLFWKCLGKGLEWEKGTTYTFISPARIVERVNPRMSYSVPKHKVTRTTKANPDRWEKYMHQFVDHLISGKDVDSYFKKLYESIRTI